MTEQDKKKIVALWQSGMSISQIKQLFPVKLQEYRDTIREMKANGEFPTERKSTVQKIKEAIESGERNPYEIAETYGISYYTVRYYKSLLGIKTVKTQNFKEYSKCEKTKTIKSEIALGEKSLSQIAKDNNVSRQYVSYLKKRMEI